jgi:acetyl esterase/lipase
MMKTIARRVFHTVTLLMVCLLVTNACRSPDGIGAKQADTPQTPPAVKRLTVIDDIAYRQGASKAWRLDLAMPEGLGNDELLPAIVIVHGGGWRAGSKRDKVYRDLLQDYAMQGYVTVSVEYRLTSEASFPACIEDIKCAVRWLRAHADKYHVDPDRIGAFGHSAGAHLVMMLAMCPPSAGLEGDGGWDNYSSMVNAVVAGSTPTQVLGRGLTNAKWVPMTYVSADVPPILLIQGTADRIVPVETVDEFVEALKKAGAKDVTYIRIEGGNHGVAYDQSLDVTKSAMDQFFERALKTRRGKKP